MLLLAVSLPRLLADWREVLLTQAEEEPGTVAGEVAAAVGSLPSQVWAVVAGLGQG